MDTLVPCVVGRSTSHRRDPQPGDWEPTSVGRISLTSVAVRI